MFFKHTMEAQVCGSMVTGVVSSATLSRDIIQYCGDRAQLTILGADEVLFDYCIELPGDRGRRMIEVVRGAVISSSGKAELETTTFELHRIDSADETRISFDVLEHFFSTVRRYSVILTFTVTVKSVFPQWTRIAPRPIKRLKKLYGMNSAPSWLTAHRSKTTRRD